MVKGWASRSGSDEKGSESTRQTCGSLTSGIFSFLFTVTVGEGSTPDPQTRSCVLQKGWSADLVKSGEFCCHEHAPTRVPPSQQAGAQLWSGELGPSGDCPFELQPREQQGVAHQIQVLSDSTRLGTDSQTLRFPRGSRGDDGSNSQT